MSRREQLIQKTIDLHREIVKERLTRRDLLKLGLLSASTGLLLPIPGLSLRAAWGKGGDDDVVESCPLPGTDIISPPTTPWKDPMPRLHEKATVAGNNPDNISWGNGGGAPGPDPVGTLTGGDSKIKLLYDDERYFFSQLAKATPYANLSHQGWGKTNQVGRNLGDRPPQDWYEMRVQEFYHHWHSDMPASRNGGRGQAAWGFDGMFPGPMFRTHYDRAHFVRIHNDLHLARENLGFGINQITTHLHNLHSPSESDGNPLYTNYPGHYYDHHYPNICAGANERGDYGDPNEALGTLFYHDHKLDFTAQNVYAGLVGMNCIYDDTYDTGDHDDATGLRLPCGDEYEFDVGLVLHDRQFDPEGRDFFPLTCFDGALGDKFTVNGKIQPFMDVEPRRYRFRFLNIGPSRYYWWFLSLGDDRMSRSDSREKMTVIANDGNILPYAVETTNFKQGVAERFDIVIDFSKYKGKTLYLVNRAEQVSGRGPTGKLLSRGFDVLQFRVAPQLRAGLTDNSLPLYHGRPLRPLPTITPQDLSSAKRKTWKFERSGGEWVVNGESFDRFAPPYEIKEGTAERWTIINGGGSWSHPVHIHYEEHRTLSYNRLTPDPKGILGGRKDVIPLDPNAKVEMFMRFRDYKGIYPMHCHNVVHEDHAMMVMWKIV